MSTFFAITTKPKRLMAGDVVLSTSCTVFYSEEVNLPREVVVELAGMTFCQFVQDDDNGNDVAIYVEDSQTADDCYNIITGIKPESCPTILPRFIAVW